MHKMSELRDKVSASIAHARLMHMYRALFITDLFCGYHYSFRIQLLTFRL